MKTSHEPHVGDDDIDETLCICDKQLQRYHLIVDYCIILSV